MKISMVLQCVKNAAFYDLSMYLQITGCGYIDIGFGCNHIASSPTSVLEATAGQNFDTAIFNQYTMELVAYVQGNSETLLLYRVLDCTQIH